MALLFLAVALAGASGLLLFSHLDAQERRTEFALLRTLGLSRTQMQLMLWSGLTLMTLCGAALGALLGWLMGATLLPLMEIVESGARATPPASLHHPLAPPPSILRHPNRRRRPMRPMANPPNRQTTTPASPPNGRITPPMMNA